MRWCNKFDNFSITSATISQLNFYHLLAAHWEGGTQRDMKRKSVGVCSKRGLWFKWCGQGALNVKHQLWETTDLFSLLMVQRSPKNCQLGFYSCAVFQHPICNDRPAFFFVIRQSLLRGKVSEREIKRGVHLQSNKGTSNQMVSGIYCQPAMKKPSISCRGEVRSVRSASPVESGAYFVATQRLVQMCCGALICALPRSSVDWIFWRWPRSVLFQVCHPVYRRPVLGSPRAAG